MLLTVGVLSMLLVAPVGQDTPQSSDSGKMVAESVANQNPWYRPFVEHLAFLGYSCEVTEESGFEYLQCFHDVWLNPAILKGTVGFTVQAYVLGAPDEPPTGEKALFANKLNNESGLVSFSWDNDGDLRLRAAFPGEYEKVRFSVFMDLWNADQQLLQSKYLNEVQRLTSPEAN